MKLFKQISVRNFGAVSRKSDLLREESIMNPSQFWGNASKEIEWFQPYDKVLDSSKKPFYKWFINGKINTCYNCIDRNIINGNGFATALIFDSPTIETALKYTYNELFIQVNKFSKLLLNEGVTKGDRVIIYMPNIPEAAIAMLSCARIGAIHSVVFGGFSSNELSVRIRDCKPKVVICSSCGIDGSKMIAYKPLVDGAIKIASDYHVVSKCIVHQRPKLLAEMNLNRDVDWYETLKNISNDTIVPCEQLDSNDPLYILYTSGTTGQPKGVLRDNGGHAVALKWVMTNMFNIKPKEVFWAASDVGWVVGHSFGIYGPLLQGCTTLLYEGKPIGSSIESNYFHIIEKHKVNVFHTAPTALRAIKRLDKYNNVCENLNLSSLRYVFVAGEHADPDTVHWTERTLKVPVIDNWWQTETGWSICSNAIGLDGILPIKYGSCFLPLPGYALQCLDDKFNEVPRGKLGNLAIKLPLPPGSLLTLYGNDQRYLDAYMTKIPGYYDTGDAGIIDEDGYVHVMSRTDDIINVAGHRLSTGAMEEILSEHADVAECAVIGIKDKFRGQVPIGLIILNSNCTRTHDIITKELIDQVRHLIGPVAFFKKVVIVNKLPKTRSGKILRGTMRSIANGDSYKIPPTIEDISAIDEVVKVIKDHENDVIK